MEATREPEVFTCCCPAPSQSANPRSLILQERRTMVKACGGRFCNTEKDRSISKTVCTARLLPWPSNSGLVCVTGCGSSSPSSTGRVCSEDTQAGHAHSRRRQLGRIIQRAAVTQYAVARSLAERFGFKRTAMPSLAAHKAAMPTALRFPAQRQSATTAALWSLVDSMSAPPTGIRSRPWSQLGRRRARRLGRPGRKLRGWPHAMMRGHRGVRLAGWLSARMLGQRWRCSARQRSGGAASTACSMLDSSSTCTRAMRRPSGAATKMSGAGLM